MSFLWGSSASSNVQQEFDQLLDKTTSDLLPSQTPADLVECLQLADYIRASQVTPQSATKSFQRRFKHSNPNVQLLALQVLDICIKNGGTPFLLQAGAKDLVADLEHLARNSASRDVRQRTLAKLQEWATAFQAKDNLRHLELVRTYERMHREASIEFPQRDLNATAAMVDSLSAPEWTDSSYCTRCRTDFSTFNRKHHCRNCGDVFDQACSSTVAPLPHYGITEPVRVCDGCAKKVKEGKGATVAAAHAQLSRSTSVGNGQHNNSSNRTGLPGRSSSVSYTSPSSSRGNTHRGSKSVASGSKSKEDDDLQRAIEASLRDVNPSAPSGPAFELRKNPPAPVSQPGYNPDYASRIAPDSKYSSSSAVEEDDPDLAAAIAASLKDSAPPPSAPTSMDGPAVTYASLYGGHAQAHDHSSAYPSLSVNTTSRAQPSYGHYAPLPSLDLSPVETTALDSFARQPLAPGAYEQARAAAVEPRLASGLEAAQRRRELLVEMNDKLGEAARLYQGLLEDKARAHNRPNGVAGTTGPSPYAYSYAQQAQPEFYGQQQGYAHHAPVPQPPPVSQTYDAYAGPNSAAYQPYATAYSGQNPYAAPPLSNQGQPLPYNPTPQNQPHYHQTDQAQAAPVSPQPPQQHHQPQQQQQHSGTAWPAQSHASAPPQPAGYYKPSQFPSVPQGAEAVLGLLPSVPSHDTLAQQQQQEEEIDRTRRDREQEQATPVGELIEL